MSRLLDILEHAAHGSPAGYRAGCKSKGGCPNHGSRHDLTCVRAYRAAAHYGVLHLLDPETPITKAMLRAAKGRAS